MQEARGGIRWLYVEPRESPTGKIPWSSLFEFHFVHGTVVLVESDPLANGHNSVDGGAGLRIAISDRSPAYTGTTELHSKQSLEYWLAYRG
jgi:hypothetical protein